MYIRLRFKYNFRPRFLLQSHVLIKQTFGSETEVNRNVLSQHFSLLILFKNPALPLFLTRGCCHTSRAVNHYQSNASQTHRQHPQKATHTEPSSGSAEGFLLLQECFSSPVTVCMLGVGNSCRAKSKASVYFRYTLIHVEKTLPWTKKHLSNLAEDSAESFL